MLTQEITTPSKEEFYQWKNSNTGKWYFEQWVLLQFQNLIENMVHGSTLDVDSVDGTALASVRQITRANTLYDVANVSYEEILNSLSSEESIDVQEEGDS